MKKLATYILAILAIVLAGCASTSGNVGLQNGSADKIIEGKTTIAEVKDLLGDPASASTDDRGGKAWSYYWSQSKVYPVPGLNNVETKTLNIRFNKNGIVVAKDNGSSGSRF